MKHWRAGFAYLFVKLAMWLHPPLRDELVEMVIHPILNNGEPLPISKVR